MQGQMTRWQHAQLKVGKLGRENQKRLASTGWWRQPPNHSPPGGQSLALLKRLNSLGSLTLPCESSSP